MLEDVLENELCLFETDAFTRYRGYPNPAALGTFPKILGQYVRDRHLISMENAIRRMTSDSAHRFGIKDRGVLAAGKKPDIVVFDPETISETPAKGHSGRLAQRISHVFINGRHVVENGEYKSGVRRGGNSPLDRIYHQPKPFTCKGFLLPSEPLSIVCKSRASGTDFPG
ncbi:MAG: amidohydrolase family protein [Desulfobacterales bacterium]